MISELVAPFRRTSGVPEGRVQRLAISIVQRYMPGANPNPKAMQHTRECQLSSLRSASGQAARGTAQNAFCTATGRFTPSAVLRMTVCCRPMITQETLTPQSVDDSSQPEVQRQRNKVLLDGIEKTLKPKP